MRKFREQRTEESSVAGDQSQRGQLHMAWQKRSKMACLVRERGGNRCWCLLGRPQGGGGEWTGPGCAGQQTSQGTDGELVCASQSRAVMTVATERTLFAFPFFRHPCLGCEI